MELFVLLLYSINALANWSSLAKTLFMVESEKPKVDGFNVWLLSASIADAGLCINDSDGDGVCNELEIIGDIKFPHSLGLLYSAFTYYCGFKVNSGEYKLMGLAPFGKPKYSKIIKDNIGCSVYKYNNA